MRASYKTIAREAQAELVEKKSRFIATVCPVSKETEATDLIAQMRSKYYDATHNVFAYILSENNISRFSDDGEPSGTAGVPVLEVLKKEGLVDLAVVVTRYFGGTLLGAGGLIRAYGAAAKLGVDAGGIIVRALCDLVLVHCDYTLFGKVQYETLAAGFSIANVEYGGEVVVSVHCEVSRTQAYLALIRDATNARALCEVAGQLYVDMNTT